MFCLLGAISLKLFVALHQVFVLVALILFFFSRANVLLNIMLGELSILLVLSMQ
jgi:hypothetical protein